MYVFSLNAKNNNLRRLFQKFIDQIAQVTVFASRVLN